MGTGLRPSEIAGLELRDLHVDDEATFRLLFSATGSPAKNPPCARQSTYDEIMHPTLFLVALLCLLACSSSLSSSSGGDSGSMCPNVAGTWNITEHCDPSLVGQRVVVTQTGCSLSFAAPFNGFTGTLASDGKIIVSGPQSCTGAATASSISMSCTPGTCKVALAR
jgi:hypothetical protein